MHYFKIIKIILILGLFGMLNMYGVIVSSYEWYHPEKEQKVFALGDMHQFHPYDKIQVNSLMQWLDDVRVRLILEDVDPQKEVLPPSSSRFLRTLNRVAQHNDIATTHVEFRQVWPWTKTKEYAAKLDEVVQEIEHFDDGCVLNNEYRQTVPLVMTMHKPLHHALKQYDGSLMSYQIKSYLAHFFGGNKEPFTKLHASTLLLDFRILHAIAESKKRNICVCAGMGHIERINNLLPQMGFSLHNRTGPSGKESLSYRQRDEKLPVVDMQRILPKRVSTQQNVHFGLYSRLYCRLPILCAMKKGRLSKRLGLAFLLAGVIASPVSFLA